LNQKNADNNSSENKYDIDKLYEEITTETKNFSEYSMDSLFKAAENNKLMQKKEKIVAGMYSKK